MKSRLLLSVLSVCGGLLSAAPLQEFTQPVGFHSYEILAGADTAVVPTVTRLSVFTGTVNGIADITVALDGPANVALPSLVDGLYYLQVFDGAAAGATATIISSSSGSVTLEESLAEFGLAPGNTVKIVPHWTLNTLLPDGKGIEASDQVFAPTTRVLLPDTSTPGTNLAASKVYFYHDGSELDAGWYSDGDVAAGLQDDVIIPPNRYVLVRKSWNYDDSFITIAGEISLAPLGTVIRRIVADIPQDHAIGIALATDLAVSELGLEISDGFAASPDVFAPTDRLLVYGDFSFEMNPSAARVIFYHDGTQLPAGWYQEGRIASGLMDDFELTGGSRIVLRRSGGDPDAQLLRISPEYLTTWDQ